MASELLRKLENKSITKGELLQQVEKNFNMLPDLIKGVSSSKPSVRYGCAAILMNLSEKYPEKLYQHIDFFIDLLDSEYRILTWNAMAIIANLAKIDKHKRFDAIFDKYYGFLNDDYMVTVANVVGSSGKIASAKPYLIQKITNELLKVENISTTPHLTEECRRVIAEKAIASFNLFYDKIRDKGKVITFVRKHANSPRKTLKKRAEDFLKKWTK